MERASVGSRGDTELSCSMVAGSRSSGRLCWVEALQTEPSKKTTIWSRVGPFDPAARKVNMIRVDKGESTRLPASLENTCFACDKEKRLRGESLRSDDIMLACADLRVSQGVLVRACVLVDMV